jgi:hypothetical protein
MKHTESYIDSSIKDPEGLPSVVVGFLDDLRKYDKEGEWAMYYGRLDDLCILVKDVIADGGMSEKDWETIVKKYWVHADKIYNKECEAEKNETSEFINNS